MTILSLDPHHPDPEAIRQAVEVIRQGGVIAAPTDTVYGLLTTPFNDAAVRRVYQVKGRSFQMPLILLVADMEIVERFAIQVPEPARQLMEKFWPGALTVILKAGMLTPSSILSGGETVGFRMPDHAVPLKIMRAAGIPLASTSANRSGEPASVSMEHIVGSIGGEIDLVIDAGAAPLGRESTIVDLSGEVPRLLREGYIARQEIEAVLHMSSFET